MGIEQIIDKINVNPVLKKSWEYHKKGWRIVKAVGKVAQGSGATIDEVDDFTDEDFINYFVTSHPELKYGWEGNIGLVGGENSDLIIIDFDIYKQKDYTLESFQSKFMLPKTLMAVTGRGGYHFYYRWRAGFKGNINVKDFYEVKNHNQYCIASPSIHPDTGKPYEWINEGHYVADLTDEAIEELKGYAGKSSEKEKLEIKSELKIYEGQGRNNFLAKVAGKLVKEFGNNKNLIKALVRSVNNTCCVPPLGSGKFDLPDEDYAVAESIIRTDTKNTDMMEIDGVSMPEVKSDIFTEFDSEQIKKNEKEKKLKEEELDYEILDLKTLQAEYVKEIGENVAIPTNISVLDEAFEGGFRQEQVIVIAGITGEGKSTLLYRILSNFSKQGHKCFVFSYELNYAETLVKLERMGAVIDNFKQTRKIFDKTDLIKDVKKIMDKGLSMGIKIFAFDLLEFLKIDKDYKALNGVDDRTTSIIGAIMKEIKTYARANQCLIFPVAHVNKNPHGVHKEPGLDEIKDSSAIAQHSDGVIFCYRPKWKDLDIEVDPSIFKDNSDYSDYVKIKVEKNRLTGKRLFQMYRYDVNKEDYIKEEIKIINNNNKKQYAKTYAN